MKFGLMFFAASEDSLDGDKYRLIIDSATFADTHGFSSLWVPERHFTRFGGLYPNPAVLHAALAMCTRTLRLNAGSLVAPLHHPMRVAEEWSVVDNLSHGRVGLSFASGWNPDDFVFFPDRYATRHDQLFDALREVRRLWRGGPFDGVNGAGRPARVTLHPAPIQPELPVWVTAAGNPATFERAGASGAHLLTHLLDQDEEVLASKIAIYRKARAAAGYDPSTGEVTLMLHTFVGADAADVRERARRPYCDYIKANLGLLAGLARSRGREADLGTMSPADRDEFVNFLYERFAAERGLIGTPESCAPLVARLERIGVTEAACLLDFGPDAEAILEGLPHLARLKDACASSPSQPDAVPSARAFVPDEVVRRCGQQMSGDEFHGVLRRHGVEIDHALQMIRTVWRRNGEALAELAVGDAGIYCVHPAALDACTRVLAAALPDDVFAAPAATMYVPAGMRACEVSGPLSGLVWSHAIVTESPDGGSGSFAGDVRIYDQRGRLLVEVRGLRLEALAHVRPADRQMPHASERAQVATAKPGSEGWLYERTWEPTPEAVSSNADLRGRWLIVDDAHGVGARLRELIQAEGGVCVDRQDAGGDLRGVVYLRGLDAIVDPSADAKAVRAHVDRSVHGALDLVSPGSGAGHAVIGAPLWIVTSAAMPVGDAPSAISPAQAPLWGFGRALAVERPGALGALVDIDPAEPAALSARRLADLIGVAGSRATTERAERSTVEDMVAFRSGARYVPRLRPLDAATSRAAPPLAFGADDIFLITGGTGGLGLRVASWLASRGVRHVILVGRRPLSPSAQSEVDRLSSTGVDVAFARADVADYARLQSEVANALAGRPPLAGIFHLAGVLDDGELAQQTWERFDRVLASKVDGAWNLHQLARDVPLAHFVLFSSVASMVPVPGQSNYASANAFLDALAHYRRAAGLPALTVNWGPWSESGHAATDYGRRAHAQLASLGINALPPDDAFGALEALMLRQRTQTAVVDVDWPKLFRADPGAERLGLLAGLARASASGGDERAPASALVLELRALPEDERRPYLLGRLSDVIVDALKLRTAEPIDPRQRLFDLGLDSILAIDVRDRLERLLGHKLSATLLFVHPTLEALSSHVIDEIVGRPVPAPAASAAIDALSEDELTTMLLREIDASHGR